MMTQIDRIKNNIQKKLDSLILKLKVEYNMSQTKEIHFQESNSRDHFSMIQENFEEMNLIF